jgi:thioredoxin-related protein
MRITSAVIVNAATVLVFVGIGALCFKEGYLPLGFRANKASERLAVGKQLPAFEKYDWRSHRETLLLVLRDGCHYCADSAPFYKRLTELESSRAINNFHILAVFPDPDDVVSNLLKLEQLKLESISSVDFGKLGVTGTPTAVLVDQSGKVLDLWVGELDDKGQQTLVNKLRSGSAL